MRNLRIAAVLAALAPYAAEAATIEELKRYDLNRNQNIDAGKELELYLIHLASPVLAKYDVITVDGKLDAAELALLYRDARDTYNSREFLPTVGYLKDRAAQGGIPLSELASRDGRKEGSGWKPDCDRQERLFIRRDRLDVSIYNNDIGKSAAQGASISFKQDFENSGRSATVDGFVSYVLSRDPCAKRPEGVDTFDSFVSGHALASWIGATGSLSNVPSQDKSSLKLGLDAQAEIFSGPFFDNQYVTFSPYVQTDFRGIGRAYGASASWEPFLFAAKLGGTTPAQRISPWFDYFWQFKAEVDALHVDTPGRTNLKANTSYLWIGATARINFFELFGSERIYAVAAYQYYTDVRSNQTAAKFTGELGYHLTPDKSTSVSIVYEKGTERSTMQDLDQYKVNLNVKF